MIDLTFSDGAAGTLLHALDNGSSKDIMALNFALDIGDISNIEDNLSSREKTIHLLYGDYDGVAEEMFAHSKKALERLHETAKTKEPIRIWLSESDPAELCGLYYTCSLIDDDVPISIVRIPTHKVDGKVITHYYSSGEVATEKFAEFVKAEVPLSKPERHYYAIAWKELVAESAPLRVVVNGKLLGVPEDIYDFAIRYNLPDCEILSVKVIGKTLIMVPGVSDRWIFIRLNKMIERGELIEISPAEIEHPYSAIYKKA